MNYDYLLMATPYQALTRRLPQVLTIGTIIPVIEQLENALPTTIGAWVEVTTNGPVTGRDTKGPQDKPTALYFSGREAREGKLDNELWSESK